MAAHLRTPSPSRVRGRSPESEERTYTARNGASTTRRRRLPRVPRPADYGELARIINANARGEDDDRVETAEGIASGYEHLKNCDLDRDLVVAEVDGTPVAYTRVSWDQEVDGPRVYRMFCFTDPAFRGRGIGTALVEWDMARLREIAARARRCAGEALRDVAERQERLCHGHDPPSRLRADHLRRDDGAPDRRRPPRPPAPGGLEIRPVREEDMRTIWEADVEAFRDHWGFTEQTEEAYQQFISFPVQRPDAVEDRVGRRGRPAR